MAGRRPLTQELLRRQLVLYGRVAMLADDAPQRRVLFEPSSLRLVASQLRRGRGRPRQQWPQSVHSHALRAAGSEGNLAMLLLHERSAKRWAALARQYSADLEAQTGGEIAAAASD